MKTSAKAGYIPTLDGWRAIAIAAVMISHAQRTYANLGVTAPSFLAAASWGRLGVDLFFAISGFLICNRLLRETQERGEISLGAFYIRRAFRILPLYLLYLTVLFILSRAAHVPASVAEIRDCLLFCRNYANPPLGVYTNHFWSLSVEEHFYLFWPVFLLAVGARRAAWITPALALCVHVWRGVDSRYHLLASILPNDSVLWRTDTRLDALLWGCFAALFCFHHTIRLPSLSPWLILSALVVSIWLRLPMQPLIFALLFPLLIVSTISNPDSPFGRFLEWRPLRWVGRLSYSLYVWQTLFLQNDASSDPAWLNALKTFPVNLLMIFAVAIASHYLLEQPLIHAGKWYLRRQRRLSAGEQREAAQPAL